MKIKTKHIVIGVASVLGVAALFGGRKALKTKNIAEQLEIQLRGIGSFPELFGLTLRSSVHIAIINPTPEPLSIQTAGLVRLSKIRIFNKAGNLAATATPNIEALEIPAYSEITRKVPIESSVQGFLNTILLGSANIEDYRVESEIEAFGQTFTI